ADQKVGQVVSLAHGLTEGRAAVQDELDAASAALADRHDAPGVRDGAVRQLALAEADFSRDAYEVRGSAQLALVLTAVRLSASGPVPRPGDIGRSRARCRRGEVPQEEHEACLRSGIDRVVARQGDVGLDVLVHGAAERNEMVQYFAEHL